MLKKKEQKQGQKKCTKRNERIRIRISRKKRPLNLPDHLWQKYKSSRAVPQKPIVEKVKQKISEEHVHIEERKVVDEKKVPFILKQLAVKVDDYLIFPNKWDALAQKLNESIELQKSMYQNLINAKQILVSCSVRTVITKIEESNAFTHHIITADSQLEEVIKSIHKQEDSLSRFKQIFDDVSLPLQIMNTSFIKDTNQERLSCILESKQEELQNEKEKHHLLWVELQKCQKQIPRIKNSFKKYIQEKNKKISQLKLKLYKMKKHFTKMHKTHQVKQEINVNSMESHIHQFTTLLGLTQSMWGTIVKDRASAAKVSPDEKENIIANQEKQLKQLKAQNTKKNKEIKKLILSSQKAVQEKEIAEEKIKTIEKETSFKINQLESKLNEFKRKHDRWIMDRHYQKCLNIMLQEKIKEHERNQLPRTFSNIKKLKKNE